MYSKYTRNRPNKMGNILSRCTMGHSHRSKLESAVCQLLCLRMKSGEFVELNIEQRVPVCGEIGHTCNHSMKIDYYADFKCTKADGSIFYVEAKGYEAPVWKLKRRLWLHNIKWPLEIWGGTCVKPRIVETIFKD